MCELTCHKCGCRDTNTFYCKGGSYTWECSFRVSDEHLHRQCRCCKFEWIDKVLEVQP